MNKTRIFFISVLVLVECISFSKASTPLALTDLEKKALENSIFLRSQAKQVDSDRLKSKGAGLLPNPTWILQGGREDSFPSSGTTWDITVSQLLPFPGKLSIQKRLRQIQSELSEANESEAKLIVQHQVVLCAARVAMWNEISKHSLERKRRFRMIQNFLKRHPQASPSQQIEAILIENQILLLEKGILETERDRKTAGLELNLYLQYPDLPFFVFEWVKKPVQLSRNEMEKKIFNQNYDLKRISLEVGHAVEQLKKAEKDVYPDFNLGVNYRVENVTPANYFYSASIGFTLPLWDYGQYTKPALKAALEKEELLKQWKFQKLKADFEVAFIRLESSAEILTLFPLSLIQVSEKKFLEAEKQLEKNRISITSFFQIDAQVHETLDSIYKAQVSYLESLSQIQFLAGRPIFFN